MFSSFYRGGDLLDSADQQPTHNNKAQRNNKITMRNIRSRRIAILILTAAALVVESSGVFVGPGLIECEAGECDFSVVQPGLNDPCHIYTSNHPYEESFEDISVISHEWSNDISICNQYRFILSKSICNNFRGLYSRMHIRLYFLSNSDVYRAYKDRLF